MRARAALHGLALGFATAVSVLLPLDIVRAAHYEKLYSFQGGADGYGANEGPLIMDDRGNLYGTTAWGGTSSQGTVFKVTPAGVHTVLYSFKGRPDGSEPASGLVADKDGNLYGVTWYGGLGSGTVFKLAPDGTETVLHAFAGGHDGMWPFASLIADRSGSFYGITWNGGGSKKCANGCGTVFRITPDGVETIVHAFRGGSDGEFPMAALLMDKAGNLYGTTSGGGSGHGVGTVFKLAPDGTKTILHVFDRRTDGLSPQTPLIMDSVGNLYGTTEQNGYRHYARCPYHVGCGTVFKLSQDGGFTVLHAFTGGRDGARPSSGLVRDRVGNLYGATGFGGACDCGTIFRITPEGAYATVYSAKRSGIAPGALIIDKHDNIFGDAEGSYRYFGSIFRFKP